MAQAIVTSRAVACVLWAAGAMLVPVVTAHAAGATDRERASTFLAKGFQAAPGTAPVVLIPGGVSPETRKDTEARVRDQLARRLRGAGLVADAMPQPEFESAFRAAADAQGGVLVPGTNLALVTPHLKASGQVAVAACRPVECAFVVRYRVVERFADIVDGTYADWDGVRHGIEYVHVPQAPTGYHATGIQSRGLAPAWSVELVGFRPQGDIVFRTFGGLALTSFDDVEAKHWVQKDHSPSDAEVAQAVDAALDSWLKR